jgi:hypothetical protein
VSIARWNLKEAAGKALARRTEIAYEACKLDEKANVFKVRYLYGSLCVYAAGISVKVRAHYPGRSVSLS